MLINGQPATQISALDRGLAYGDGLFETILVMEGIPVFLNQHLDRLHLGCRRLGLPEPSITDLRVEINAVIGNGTEGVLKIIYTRGSGRRGYALPAEQHPTRILQFIPDEITINHSIGISMRLCQTRLSMQTALAGLKHLNQLDHVLARSEWTDAQYQEGLMLDADGLPIEGTMSNLFIVRTSDLSTPELDRCGIAGIIRQQLIESSETMGHPAKIERLTLFDVKTADEIFICNSLIGIRPVTQFEGQVYPYGAVTQSLQAALLDRIQQDLDQHIR